MVLPTKLVSFWATWKFKIIAGVAILAALAIAIFAAHTIGYNKGTNISKVEIQKYEKKVQGLNAQLAKRQVIVNDNIVTEYLTIKDIQEKLVYRNREVIRNVIVPRDTNISEGAIYAHNQAALGLPIDFDLAKIATPSSINDNKLIEGVAENYAISARNSNRFELLQKWIKDSQEAQNEVADSN